nr:hypothetical protein [Tanacetum cinerariifolium]
MAITYAIFKGENSESNVINTVQLGLSMYNEILFQPLFDEYYNPPPRVVSLGPVAVAAQRVVDPAGSPLSTTIDQDVPSANTSPTTQKINLNSLIKVLYGHQNAQFDNAPLLHNLSLDPSSEETALQGFIPSNVHHFNQSFDTLTKLTKNHPLENVIGDPSQPVLTRSQLQGHAIWCYFDANDNLICTDITNITRNQPKPDKNGHKNGKSTQEPEIIKQSQPKSILVNLGQLTK